MYKMNSEKDFLFKINQGTMRLIKDAFGLYSAISLKITYPPNSCSSIYEGLDGGGVWYSLFIKNLAHYSSH